MKWMNRIALVCAFALAAAAFSGCNTFRGLGKDIEKAGEKIQEGADKAQK